jgi:hypothetical protein
MAKLKVTCTSYTPGIRTPFMPLARLAVGLKELGFVRPALAVRALERFYNRTACLFAGHPRDRFYAEGHGQPGPGACMRCGVWSEPSF